MNLIIVATLGVIMRYKIGFQFPYLEQKYLLHAHSHFAFAGWVSHIIFTMLVFFLKEQLPQPLKHKKYNFLIISNLICAYGMLFSFMVQGYGAVSISFSTLSILVGYAFAWFYFQDLKNVPANHPSKNWFKAALLFNILSSAGTFYLAYMMVTKQIDQHAYLASVYFYLHFQYSGWFFFAMMGLLITKLNQSPVFVYDRAIFKYFFIACFPAFFLSVLWLKLPLYIYSFTILAVILQLFGLLKFILLLRKNFSYIFTQWIKPVRIILGLSLIALVIKILLQAGSIFPDISDLAFGFRSIVIAYLHLVLLGITTLFLLGFLLLNGYIRQIKMAINGLILFCIGVFANELVLTIQGVASFGYILIPHLNLMLLLISLFMWISMMIVLFSYKKT
ncbi:MAG: hypothetical protein IPM42_01995 [Saprospiraceae bacterium]|nr:hypothetical protein [Saprospiraceae bacterium]